MRVRDYDPEIEHIFNLIKANAYTEALALLRGYTRPGHPADIQYGIARCLSGLGKVKKAIKLFKKNIENYPYLKSNYAALYNILRRENRIEESDAVLKQMSRTINEAEALLVEARWLKHNGKRSESLEKFKCLVEQFPDHKMASLDMLVVNDRIANTLDTLTDLENFMKQKNISIEKYPQAYLHYAVQLQKFKRYEKAIEILKALIEKFPEDMHHYATLALTTEFQNDDENAEKRYLNMLSKFPFYQNGHLLYGMFLQKHAGRFDEAEKQYLRMLHLFPSCKEAHLGLAILYHGHFESDRAIFHATKAINIDSEYDPAYSALSHIYIDMSKQDHAKDKKTLEQLAFKYYDKACQINKNRFNNHKAFQTDPNISSINNRLMNFLGHQDSVVEKTKVTEFQWPLPPISMDSECGESTMDYSHFIQRENFLKLYHIVLPLYRKIDISSSSDLIQSYHQAWNEIEQLAKKADYPAAQSSLTELHQRLKVYHAASCASFKPGEQYSPVIVTQNQGEQSKQQSTQTQIIKKMNLFANPEPEIACAHDAPPLITQSEVQKQACLDLMNEIDRLLEKHQQIDFTKQKKILTKAGLLFDQSLYQEALVLLEKLPIKIHSIIHFMKEHQACSDAKSDDAILSPIDDKTKHLAKKDIHKKHKKKNPIQKTQIQDLPQSIALEAERKPIHDSSRSPKQVVMPGRVPSCAKIGLFAVSICTAGFAIYNSLAEETKISDMIVNKL